MYGNHSKYADSTKQLYNKSITNKDSDASKCTFELVFVVHWPGKSASVFLTWYYPVIVNAKLMNKDDHIQLERLLEFKIKIIRLLIFVCHILRNQWWSFAPCQSTQVLLIREIGRASCRERV